MNLATKTDWTQATTDQLIDHLLESYHARHRDHLPLLIDLARKIECIHEGEAGCPAGLTQHLISMQQELDSHMMKEEQILFPMLRRGLLAQARGPVSVMLMEHEEHEAGLARLRQMTNNLTLPSGVCTSWAALYDELALFVAELTHHIELENTILFAGRTRDQLGSQAS